MRYTLNQKKNTDHYTETPKHRPLLGVVYNFQLSYFSIMIDGCAFKIEKHRPLLGVAPNLAVLNKYALKV